MIFDDLEAEGGYSTAVQRALCMAGHLHYHNHVNFIAKS